MDTGAGADDPDLLDEHEDAYLDTFADGWSAGDDLDDDLEDEPLETGPAPRELLGRVAVVGYPNVGKSTLVNRLSESRVAIVHSEPGVTRDRKEVVCDWNGEEFLLIDTGGVDSADPRPIARQTIEQARVAIAEADLVLFVVDAGAGMSAADEEVADLLRRAKADVVVVANKLDNPAKDAQALEFHALALGDPMPVSAHHGNGTGDLLDEVVERLRAKDRSFVQPDEQAVIKVALLGRPNVGKSTLTNAFLGSDRTIVSDVAGTTRDSIDTPFRFAERDLVLIDTAGIRRKGAGKEREPVEYYGEVRSLQAADRADVALVLVDASQGLRESDVAIADQARQRDCATIVLLAKWDLSDVDLADVQKTLQQKLRQRPEVVTVSGLTGRNVQKVLGKVVELYDRYAHRVPTAKLNEHLKAVKDVMPGPSGGPRSKKRLNMLYATQYQVAPPRMRIVVNDRSLMTRNYGYFVENQLRERCGFEGCPLIIDYAERS